MASSTTRLLLLVALFASAATCMVEGFQFQVGEDKAWKKPTGKNSETYNQWAANHRFHIGDSLYFKYKEDSVLLVTSADYLNCNTQNPTTKFDDGSTVFQFDRSGFFYFISGEPGHCESGQKVIIRVMHPTEYPSAPSPAEDWSPQHATNSTTKLAVIVSFLMAATAAVSVLLYLIM